MSKFTRKNISINGGYISYCDEQGAYRFIARFKYVKSNAGPFVTFLIKNFTPEEFFARIDANETPLEILQSKGFVLQHIKRWLKRDGYPQTQEGYAQWRKDKKSVA